MREQRLTVASFYPPGWHGSSPYRAVPFLPLAGPWLREAGFSVGSEVRVRAEPGRVVVELRELAGGAAGGEEG
jgi:hypothetical protein